MIGWLVIVISWLALATIVAANTATGHCASLTVSGSSNQVSIESADTISPSGVGNAITYQSGTPRVTTAGVSNTVSRRQPLARINAINPVSAAIVGRGGFELARPVSGAMWT